MRLIRALIRFARIWLARAILRFGNRLADIAGRQIEKADRGKRQ